MAILQPIVVVITTAIVMMLAVFLTFVAVMALIGLGKVLWWMLSGPTLDPIPEKRVIPQVVTTQSKPWPLWKKPEPVLLEDDRLNIPVDGEVMVSVEGKKDS